ncbi:Pentatricopeptide repeat-containing -like protein [Gossypium arboreum]|uniref:Pentatricopeptide repeat-containing-like protein n=1 Tax=Gossypium arboreum TaxID=29729 RepID=A0A0B0P0N9_GOSAR|nr:Pentatricopeptide repeat-containing -like protein [Gossypium arboreum]
MFWRPGTGLAYSTGDWVARHVLQIPNGLCEQTRWSKENFNGNLDEYVKDKKISCYVQVGTVSSGWRSSEILSHYQAIIWAILIGLYWLMGCKHINYSYAYANVIV